MQTCTTINLGEQKILLFACLFLPWNVVLRWFDSEYGRENHCHPPAGCSELCCHTHPGCHPWGASCSSSGKGNAMPTCPSAWPLLCTPPNCSSCAPSEPMHQLHPRTQWHPRAQHPLCTGTSRPAALPLLPRLFQGSSFGRNQCLVQAWTNRIKLLAAIFCLVIWHWSIFITVMTCLEVINGWRKTNFVQILLWHICTRQSDTLNIYEVCHFSNTQIESQFTLIYNEIKNLQILLPQYC